MTRSVAVGGTQAPASGRGPDGWVVSPDSAQRPMRRRMYSRRLVPGEGPDCLRTRTEKGTAVRAALFSFEGSEVLELVPLDGSPPGTKRPVLIFLQGIGETNCDIVGTNSYTWNGEPWGQLTSLLVNCSARWHSGRGRRRRTQRAATASFSQDEGDGFFGPAGPPTGKEGDEERKCKDVMKKTRMNMEALALIEYKKKYGCDPPMNMMKFENCPECGEPTAVFELFMNQKAKTQKQAKTSTGKKNYLCSICAP